MPAQTIARGQISFVDLNDGKSLNLTLMSNRALTQLYDIDLRTYTPDYATNNLVVTPTLHVSGETSNQMGRCPYASVSWKINGVAASSFASGVSVSTTAPYTLTISANNVANSGFMTLDFAATYQDPDTGLSTDISAQITYTIVETTGELIRAIAYAQGPTVFYNDVSGTQEVTLHCDMWRGSDIDAEGVAYQWYRKDNPDPTAADSYDWYKIVQAYSGASSTPATGTFPDGQTWQEVLPNGLVGYTNNELTIGSEDIVNYDAFCCTCTDTQTSPQQPTYGSTVRSETITVLDWTDPYYLDFVTAAGTTLTSNTTSLTTVAHVWQRGEELSDSIQNAFYYRWTKANKNGRKATGVNAPGGTSGVIDIDDYKASANKSSGQDYPPKDSNWVIDSNNNYRFYGTGSSARSLTLYKDEISVKNTFFCEVVIP